jgi:hypothetical protein
MPVREVLGIIGFCSILLRSNPPMSDDLLSTKLYIPTAPGEMVSRPHLFHLLDQSLSRKLTLLSAPAGFGKTMLLGEWSRRCGAAVAWLSLALVIDAAASIAPEQRASRLTVREVLAYE